MADLLQKGAQFLSDARNAHMSREVTYAPAAGGSAAIIAGIGRTVFEVDSDGSGSFQRSESRDFIVAADALAVDPVRGDLIREAIAGTDKTVVYEVSAPGSEPVWRWGDAYRTSRRIHTKYLETETA